MNEREQAKQIIDKLPDYKINNLLLFLKEIGRASCRERV